MARDLDLLRTVLGDERLNDLGYSYGSWLWAWYAGLFPENRAHGARRRARLWCQPGADAVRAAARQRLFDEVLAPYAMQITFALAAAWKRCAPPCRPLARTCSPCWATT